MNLYATWIVRRRRSGSVGPRCTVSSSLFAYVIWILTARSIVGPAIEAFGYSRILFGSSPSTSSTSTSNAGDWYQIAKESVAELGVDQEGIDAVFGTNAKAVYGA